MISFQPTEEQQTICESIREFAAQVMRPAARPFDEASAVAESFLAQAWDLGLTLTQIPEPYGGYGAARSPLTNTLVLEELGQGDATLALAAVAPSAFAYAILDQGTEEQRQAYLPLFCGDRYHVSSLAVAEPSSDFNAFRPRTRAAQRKDVFVLSGAKCCVPMGDRATHFLVVAMNGERPDAFIVGREAAGLTVTAPEKNLGLKALSTGRLTLEGVEVPAAARLGGAAGADVPRLLNQARTAQAAILTGVSRAVLEFCIPYAKERVAFDEPIAQKQAIAFRFADMQIEIDSMRNLTWKAASQLERGLDATRSAHFANVYAAEKSVWITDNGVQVLGGHGFIREHPVEMWYRNARTLSVLEGAAAV
jgi:alkylation response protein AidB-like acyl-CoA dehydrogenase